MKLTLTYKANNNDTPTVVNLPEDVGVYVSVSEIAGNLHERAVIEVDDRGTLVLRRSFVATSTIGKHGG